MTKLSFKIKIDEKIHTKSPLLPVGLESLAYKMFFSKRDTKNQKKSFQENQSVYIGHSDV